MQHVVWYSFPQIHKLARIHLKPVKVLLPQVCLSGAYSGAPGVVWAWSPHQLLCWRACSAAASLP